MGSVNPKTALHFSPLRLFGLFLNIGPRRACDAAGTRRGHRNDIPVTTVSLALADVVSILSSLLLTNNSLKRKWWIIGIVNLFIEMENIVGLKRGKALESKERLGKRCSYAACFTPIISFHT